MTEITSKKEIKTSYFVCPFDGTPSKNMKLCWRIEKDQITFREREALEGYPPIAGERLQCPKCGRIFGWHQLKKVKENEG